MAKALRPNLARFYDFIGKKNEGDVVSEAELMAAAGWQKSTLDTHRNKNALDPFLIAIGGGTYRVRRDGTSISKDAISKAFTQIRPSDLVLLPGIRLKSDRGDYELVSELGRGAVAHVWKAVRILNGKHYALKVVNPRADLLEPSTLDNVKRRFSREAQNGMKIPHANIVTYTDHGEYKGHPFLVMEIADESLASKLQAGPLTVVDSLRVIECCAMGLQHLHRSGCVHRDVKPPNVLRFGDRFALGDLGIVRWSDMNVAFTSAGTITKDAVQLGSWYYMAPEQRQAPHKATHLSDIYELGVTWYEMLTGTTPDPAAVAAQAFDDPTRIDSVNSVIRKMLRYNPNERPTADDILSTISTIRGLLPT
jgi:serine/threonine protein kinase